MIRIALFRITTYFLGTISSVMRGPTVSNIAILLFQVWILLGFFLLEAGLHTREFFDNRGPDKIYPSHSPCPSQLARIGKKFVRTPFVKIFSPKPACSIVWDCKYNCVTFSLVFSGAWSKEYRRTFTHHYLLQHKKDTKKNGCYTLLSFFMVCRLD